MKDGWNIVPSLAHPGKDWSPLPSRLSWGRIPSPFLAQLFIGLPIKMRKSNEGWMEYCPLPGTAVHWITY